MRYCWLSVLAAGPLTSLATPFASRWDDIRVKHTWDAVPANWENLGPPLADTTIDLRIALKPDRKNALIDALYEVSSPNHPKHVSPSLCSCIYSREPLLWCRYGKHLSREQVAGLVAPHPDTLELVNSWLEYHGVSPSSISTTHGGSWLTVTGVPVSQANGLLGASYQLYRHAGTKEIILRTIGYALPAALQARVQTVAPTTYFGSPRKESHMHPNGAAALADEPVTVLSSRDDFIKVTPSVLRSLYNSENYVPSATDRNMLGIAAYHGQYPSPTDLTLFTEYFRTDATDATYTVERINGGEYDPSNPGTEGNINVQYTLGMAYPTPLIYYSTGGLPPFTPSSSQPTNTNEPYLDWFDYILSQEKIPQTINTSYGESEQTVPLDYAKSVCDLFAVLGTRGVSVLFASGNFGVGIGDCIANDGSGKVQFLPVFPASCTCGVPYTGAGTSRSLHGHAFTGPYVTSVGGTQGIDPEVAADLSSGGFSNYFEVPPYQKKAVATYLENLGDKYDGLYKCVRCRDLTRPVLTSCIRAALRVAASPTSPRNRTAFGYVSKGGEGPSEVRAARHPYVLPSSFLSMLSTLGHPADRHTQVVAGIISLLNDFQLSQGRDPLGFLNPRLYGDCRAGFKDITSGARTQDAAPKDSPLSKDGILSVSLDLCISTFNADSGLYRSQVSGPLTLGNCRKYSPVHEPSD